MVDKKSNRLFALGVVAVFLLVFCIAGYFLITQYVADYNNQLQNIQTPTNEIK